MLSVFQHTPSAQTEPQEATCEYVQRLYAKQPNWKSLFYLSFNWAPTYSSLHVG